MVLTKAAIKRLGTKAGLKRISRATYAKINDSYTFILKQIIKKAIKYTQDSKRKTIKISDIELALESLNYKMFKPGKSEIDFPKTTFKNDVKEIAGPGIRISDKAVIKLMGFMSEYLIKYVFPFVNIIKQKIENSPAQEELSQLTLTPSPSESLSPLELHQPSQFSLTPPEFSLSITPDSQFNPKPKKKKKQRRKLKRSNATAHSLAKKRASRKH